jgi:sodium/proline symporter
VQAMWLQSGWVLGDLLTWLWVHRRVRERSGVLGAASVPQLLAADDQGGHSRPITVVSGVLTFFFLGGYAAAQLKAGSAALTGLFGWAPWVGVVLGAVIVVAYCFSGGLRASIWTDAAQAIVMIGSLFALLACVVHRVGGPSALFSELVRIDPELTRFFPERLEFGFALYFLGFVFGGLGVSGQPHILVRSMAIRSSHEIAQARRIYFLWYVPFSLAAVTVGLYGRVLLPDLLAGVPEEQAAVAAEGALAALATKVLPDAVLGTLLAGVFAATMSTADSQILSCSAAVTQDIAPRFRNSYVASKAATLSVAALALAIALVADRDVFGLVLGAWSALGASLGPLLLIRIARLPLGSKLAVAMMLSGLSVELLWTSAGLSSQVFELLPGMLAPLLLYAGVQGAARALERLRKRAEA